MVDDQHRITCKRPRRRGRVVGCVLLALVVAACAGAGPREAPAPAGPWLQLLRGEDARALPMPEQSQAFTFGAGATVIVVGEGGRPPEATCTEAQRAGLLDFVDKGGRLLLLGHAASLVAALGIETEWPESTVFRWGFDARTSIGSARLGFEAVTGRAADLLEGLRPSPGFEQTFLLAGGQPCSVPLCAWRVGAPRQGEVLGRFAVELDGDLKVVSDPVFVRWERGRGEVLALGLWPDPDHADAPVRENARAFVRGAVQWLQRARRGPVVVLSLPTALAPSPAEVQSAFARRHTPSLPLLSHWGWQALPREGDTDLVRSPDELLTDVVLPSWQAGADLFELGLVDGAKGVPLPWSDADPLQRPASWHGSAPLPGWSSRAYGRLASEAHARGMLLAGAVDPLPVGPGAAERLVALRFLARELADVRRLGPAAIDGLGVRQWWRDEAGYGVSMLQDFHPGAFLYRGGELAGELAGGLRALDADDGAPRGASLAGISAVWRSGFPAGQFPLGVLDARAQRAPGVAAAAVAGGGSHGDWIVAQANDFARERIGLGGAMWWRRHDPSTFDAETMAYVHGVSQEPLLAAVAMRLSATGSDGHRAAAAALLDAAPVGFGAEASVPAAVHVLQNNWFRLMGSGGAVLWDRRGLARFRANEPIVLSPAFLRTRLFGGRPDGNLPNEEPLDLLAAGRRGEGGHGRLAVLGASTAGERLVPAVLASGELPRWPEALALDWQGAPGYHELELGLRGVRGRGVVGVSLDGALLRCAPFRAGDRCDLVVVPLHVAGAGMRTLKVAVLEGGAVAIDRLRIVRRGDVGAEAAVLVPAGSYASLRERSNAGLHAERVELSTLADFPGFLVRFCCERSSRGLQVERTFQLPAHRELAEAGQGETADALRQPFVLRAADGSLPDVVVVPLQLGRYERFVLADGVLQLRSSPAAGSESRVGFLICERGDSARLCRHAGAMFAALQQPDTFDLGDVGEASLVSDLPLSWPRIVHVLQSSSTPFLVRENGWWTWRGSQPAPDGGRWLRIRHDVGDTVQIVGGPAILARTRPGPGSLHVLALRDPEPASVTVRIVQPNLLSPPCVVMGRDFDEVRVDGRPWAWCDGRTVFLPDRVGTHRIECSGRGGGEAPRVRSTRAPLVDCSYDARLRTLVLVAPPASDRPAELPWTAVLGGPRPSRIENGEIVDEASLRHADAETKAAAVAGGVLIRFRSGITRVFYGE